MGHQQPAGARPASSQRHRVTLSARSAVFWGDSGLQRRLVHIRPSAQATHVVLVVAWCALAYPSLNRSERRRTDASPRARNGPTSTQVTDSPPLSAAFSNSTTNVLTPHRW